MAAALVAAVTGGGRPVVPAVAVGGALLLVACGAISAHSAGSTLRTIGPTVGFLAALLVLAEGCRREGLFAALGALLAARSGGGGGLDPPRDPRRLGAPPTGVDRRLLALVFAVATPVTVVLGLDATVVLLTPVVLATAVALRRSARASAYACVHLANSASLLLPVSNLTNLLAFRAVGISFARFGVLMLLPTAWAVAVEWCVLRRLTSAPSAAPAAQATAPEPPQAAPVSSFALAVLALTLAGLVASSAIAVAPVWIAVGGAVLITLPALRAPVDAATRLAGAVQPGFLLFVLGLAVIVAAAGEHGLRTVVADVLPAGHGLPALLLDASIAAVLANLVNNLPATLLLVPVAAMAGVGPVLAVLVGVGVGPNLTEVGSLATLLWRRVLTDGGLVLPRREFALLGAATVPPALIGATALLYLAIRVVG